MSLLAESPGAVPPPDEAPSRPDVPRPALLDYPHIAGCDGCRAYLDVAPSTLPSWTMVSATLAFHDSGHRHDPLDFGGGQFAWI
ncbi:MAG: hypothetical protein WAL50_08465 [Kineosporiaceae bacterium]